MSDLTTMTRGDRETLVKIARQRERLAKNQASERAAHLRADFERQMDRDFSYDENAIWKAAAEAANAAVEDAKAKVAAECERLGIPREFAPTLNCNWYGQGQNASRARRAELRRMAARTIEAAEKSARTVIETKSIETQERLMAGGLTSAEAQRFLESMPTADALMPQLALVEVKALLAAPKTPVDYD